MVDPKKAAKLIRKHFEELTTEQFVVNLRGLSHEVGSEPESQAVKVKSTPKAALESELKVFFTEKQ